jgi:hypothetical protein
MAAELLPGRILSPTKPEATVPGGLMIAALFEI